jgi:hypothetical protein
MLLIRAYPLHPRRSAFLFFIPIISFPPFKLLTKAPSRPNLKWGGKLRA